MNGVSVVIPSYNAERFIGRTLESVFVQTKRPAEVILVDDCSTDRTLEIVENIGRSAPIPIRVIRGTANSGGPAKSLNICVNAASCAWIATLDHDDQLLPQRLELQPKHCNAFP